MLKIGLTGGIGSGKSTVAGLFAKLGTTVIDTDQIAHAITQPQTPLFQTIIEHFGKTMVQADGTLDRKALRKHVFQNQKDKIWLEKTLHPVIREQMLDAINNATGHYCIVVVPLLFESNMQTLFDRVLIIDVSEAEQLQRTCARDQSNTETIQHIIDSQCTRKERLQRADDIINNHDSLDNLQQQVQQLHINYSSKGSNSR